MSLKPRGPRAIIRKIAEERKSDAGLHIIAEEKFNKAEIIAVSDTCQCGLEAGMRVFYEPGTAFPIGDADYFLIGEASIVAIIQ